MSHLLSGTLPRESDDKLTLQYYPPNINTSRCCQQPICTECFVQIKRPEATSTHLESEPACCPYCMETDFGVIYERPTAAPTPSGVLSPIDRGSSPDPTGSDSALATSPDAATSAFSVFSATDEGQVVPEAPKETVRRKSVSSKAKGVVTIDCIRPDWEDKLNAVKAQAARRANRRIVMRQVGDRLVPIGYTSSRATGQADFSMSLPPEDGLSRRQRRTREREREMEEVSVESFSFLQQMMIMEAMRLSLVDHENHQRQMHDEERAKGGSAARASGSNTPTPSSSRRSSSARDTLGSWRASQGESSSAGSGRAQAAASKLLSKINVNRSRANSKSGVHFAPSPTTLGPDSPRNGYGSGSDSGSGPRARSSSTPSPNPPPEHHSSPLATTVTTRRSLDVSHSALSRLDGTSSPARAESSHALHSVTSEAPDVDAGPETPLAHELGAAAEIEERPRARASDIPPPAPIPVPGAQFDHVEAPHLAESVFDAPPVATGDDGYVSGAEGEAEAPMAGNLIDFDAASIASRSRARVSQGGHRPSVTSVGTGTSEVSETSAASYFERPYAQLEDD